MNKLSEILIDDVTWAAGEPTRRHEWRLAIREVLDEGNFVLPGAPPHRAVLTLRPGEIVLEIRDGSGTEVATLALDAAQLREHMSEYVGIVVEMTKIQGGAASPRLEALDIAKRLAHDEAGDTVRSLLRPIGPDLATGRRIFTLLLTLLHDTTRLAHLAHRAPH